MENTEKIDILPESEQTMGEEVVVEDQQEESQIEPIPTSLHLSGVDDLNTKQIKDYIDLHIKPNYSYKTSKQYSYLEYRLDWINDSEINIIFDHNNNSDKRSSAYRSKKTIRGGRSNSRDIDIMDEIKVLSRETNDNVMDDDQIIKHDVDIHVNSTTESLDGLQNESIRGASEAIALLTDFQNIRNDHTEFAELSLEDQLSAVDQAPKLQDRKCWNLILTSKGKIIKSEEAKTFFNEYELFKKGSDNIQIANEDKEITSKQNMSIGDESNTISAIEENEREMEDYRIIHLEIRYSTELDRKVENAREYSRYYLVHGEPDKTERLPAARNQTDSYRLKNRNTEDLITGEAAETEGLLGYSEDRKEYEVSDRSRNSYHPKTVGRWRNDKYYDDQRGWRDEYRPTGRNRGGYTDSFRRENRRYGGVQKSNNFHRRNPRRNNHQKDNRFNQEDLFPDFGK